MARSLAEYSRALSDLGKVPARMSASVAKDIKALIVKQFATGTDPYGNAWAPLKASTLKRKKSNMILVETNDMFNSINVAPMQGAGVAITIDETPAIYHQRGTGKMAARPILPKYVLPKAWRAAIQKRYTETLRKSGVGS